MHNFSLITVWLCQFLGKRIFQQYFMRSFFPNFLAQKNTIYNRKKVLIRSKHSRTKKNIFNSFCAEIILPKNYKPLVEKAAKTLSQEKAACEMLVKLIPGRLYFFDY